MKLQTKTILPVIIFILALILLVYMITQEGEMGALPLLILLLSGIWMIYNFLQMRKTRK